MTIAVGDKIPSVELAVMSANGPQSVTTDELFAGKKVVLFALPGAFTPTCSAAHLPGYVVHHEAIREKGVDTIACLSVNDAFVMDAWGKAQNVDDNILMLADGSGNFTEAVGMSLDLTARHMGVRSDRYSMIVEDGVVTQINREAPGKFEVSGADVILTQL